MCFCCAPLLSPHIITVLLLELCTLNKVDAAIAMVTLLCCSPLVDDTFVELHVKCGRDGFCIAWAMSFEV